jgi:hypothetical protein
MKAPGATVIALRENEESGDVRPSSRLQKFE